MSSKNIIIVDNSDSESPEESDSSAVTITNAAVVNEKSGDDENDEECVQANDEDVQDADFEPQCKTSRKKVTKQKSGNCKTLEKSR